MYKIIISLLYTTLFFSSITFSQTNFQYLGLQNKSITSMQIGEGIIAVGTDKNGVNWRQSQTGDTLGWTNIGLADKNVRTVYPHKSGPLGWAIGAGIRPEDDDSVFIYCSYLGNDFSPISQGIDKSLTYEISSLDGFPDPTICGETFAAGNRVIYRRYFEDTVWHPVYNLTVEGNFTVVKAKVTYPTVLAGGGEGFANHLLIKSLDNGDTWESISPLIYVTSLDSTEDSARVIFVTDRSQILKSEDYGLTWAQVFQGNNEFYINKLLIYPCLDIVFAAGSSEISSGYAVIYYSNLEANSWQEIPVEINSPIVDMDYGIDYWIYFATKDSGIFRFPTVSVGVDEKELKIPNDYKIYQNYPNPFNPTTKIKYHIPKVETHGHASLQIKIFDVLGREVTTLVNKESALARAGEYEVEFDATGLPSGIYFYQIQVHSNGGGTDSFVETKKMLLLK